MHQVPCAAPKAGGASLTGVLEVESSVGYINQVGCEHWTEGCYRYRAIPASFSIKRYQLHLVGSKAGNRWPEKAESRYRRTEGDSGRSPTTKPRWSPMRTLILSVTRRIDRATSTPGRLHTSSARRLLGSVRWWRLRFRRWDDEKKRGGNSVRQRSPCDQVRVSIR
jgi:hypothetical protein